jgi:hypothetical protein
VAANRRFTHCDITPPPAWSTVFVSPAGTTVTFRAVGEEGDAGGLPPTSPLMLPMAMAVALAVVVVMSSASVLVSPNTG